MPQHYPQLAAVSQYIVVGHSVSQTAATLRIATRTAEKHLEHCYHAPNITGRA
jgi:hypothetical protein